MLCCGTGLIVMIMIMIMITVGYRALHLSSYDDRVVRAAAGMA